MFHLLLIFGYGYCDLSTIILNTEQKPNQYYTAVYILRGEHHLRVYNSGDLQTGTMARYIHDT